MTTLRLVNAAHFQGGKLDAEVGAQQPAMTALAGEFVEPWGKQTHPADVDQPRFVGAAWYQNLLAHPTDLEAWTTVTEPVPVVFQGLEGFAIQNFHLGGADQAVTTDTLQTEGGQLYRAVVQLGCPASEVGRNVSVQLRISGVDNQTVEVTLLRAVTWFATTLTVDPAGPFGLDLRLSNSVAGTPAEQLYFFGAAIFASSHANYEPDLLSSWPMVQEPGRQVSGSNRWALVEPSTHQVHRNLHPMAELSVFPTDLYGRLPVNGAPSCGAVEVGL